MFVLQDWISERKVGLKMQSILLSGLRAPDHHTVAVKKCVRWLRAQCQRDADPAKQSYMQDVALNLDLIDEAMGELEYCAVHYAHHLADAFAVIAYFHPRPAVRMLALHFHTEVAKERFHFHPETQAEFLERHKDKTNAEA